MYKIHSDTQILSHSQLQEWRSHPKTVFLLARCSIAQAGFRGKEGADQPTFHRCSVPQSPPFSVEGIKHCSAWDYEQGHLVWSITDTQLERGIASDFVLLT